MTFEFILRFNVLAICNIGRFRSFVLSFSSSSFLIFLLSSSSLTQWRIGLWIYATAAYAPSNSIIGYVRCNRSRWLIYIVSGVIQVFNCIVLSSFVCTVLYGAVSVSKGSRYKHRQCNYNKYRIDTWLRRSSALARIHAYTEWVYLSTVVIR